MEEFTVDVRKAAPEEMARAQKQTQLVFRLNHTMSMTEEYASIMKELFEDRIG